ncbi:MAG: LytR/AlgR family response regulator transcription factor [Oscillospiraceae bacterium]
MIRIAISERSAETAQQHTLLVQTYFDSAAKQCAISVFSISELLGRVNGGERFDIILMDADFGDVSGIAAAGELRRSLPYAAIIFIALDESAARSAYRLKAVRYLPNPSESELCEALEFAANASEAEKRFHPTRSAERTFFAGTEESGSIRFITNEKHRHTAHFADGTELSGNHRSSFAVHFAVLLELPEFVRISSSVIVNLRFVSQYYPDMVVMTGGERFAIGRTCRNAVREKVNSALNQGSLPDISIFSNAAKAVSRYRE